jgi:N-acetylglucosamine-6-phosphate deacetylase
MNDLIALCDATIFTGEAFVEEHALVLKGEAIMDIVRFAQVPAAARIISCADKILTPGFIDAQVNGGGNVLLNNTPTAKACLTIAKAHRRFGTTRLLPTIISDKPKITQQAIAAVHKAHKQNTGILGIHIEGPHLNEVARGAHPASFLRPLRDNDLGLYRPEGGEIMLITVAPESLTLEQIEKLRAQGVIISLGHTSASPDQIAAVLAAGATGFTHLFNGMNFNRETNEIAGPVKAALDDKASWCSLIADGYHVSTENIQLALRTKPSGKVFLVSDAMAPAASDNPRPFMLFGEEIHMENGQCMSSVRGRPAGSAITLADAVHHCIDKVGVEPGEALRMASAYPAAFLGIDDKFGKLLPGYVADIVLLNAAFKPEAVWMAGERID